MAKRSPILGYNHNVRYRGLVFHVQTEDSGVLSPHLFTHLFFGGTIISTRKLVYDAGAAEDAIKALMQAQHKAVMKDLKNGTFDEKIDQYLGGTPGLEPRAHATAPVPMPRASAPELTPTVKQERADTDVEAVPVARAKSDDALTTPVELSLEVTSDPDELSAPIELPRKAEPAAETPPAKARTKTAERGSRGSVRFNPPPPAPADLDPPTLTDDRAAIAAAVQSANAASSPQVSRTVTPAPGLGVKFRAAAPPPVPTRTAPPIPTGALSRDSAPEIEISISEEESGRHRGPRDTQVETPYELEDSDGVPRQSAPRARPPSHGAATLPPARKPSRPAITPPAVMSRPMTSDDKSGAVEIYAPPPSSVDPPPGERAERPGQYSVNRRATDVPMREKTGRMAPISQGSIPAGLGRPRSESGGKPGTRPPVPTPAAASPAVGGGIPQAIGKAGGDRNPHVTAPIASRNASPSSGVVMSRPAVIVGAPAKPAGTPGQPRVRKAREEEGRGFGQGLISEKSLDEVILAYLSEDGEDK